MRTRDVRRLRKRIEADRCPKSGPNRIGHKWWTDGFWYYCGNCGLVE